MGKTYGYLEDFACFYALPAGLDEIGGLSIGGLHIVIDQEESMISVLWQDK